MSKLTDNLDANFQLFIEEVRESGQVWGLRYGEDWVVCRSAEFEDADVMPLWSAEGDARLHCVDEWADYEPEVIELEEFLDIWINDLDEDDVLVINDAGVIIRMAAAGISTYGRTAQGVKIMNLEEGVKVISFARTDHEEEEEAAEGETPAGGPEQA